MDLHRTTMIWYDIQPLRGCSYIKDRIIRYIQLYVTWHRHYLYEKLIRTFHYTNERNNNKTGRKISSKIFSFHVFCCTHPSGCVVSKQKCTLVHALNNKSYFYCNPYVWINCNFGTKYISNIVTVIVSIFKMYLNDITNCFI